MQNTGTQESKTLWIGDIDHWMDEAYIAGLFAASGAVSSVKVIRDKTTGLPAGYGFVEFSNHKAAQDVLQSYHGKMIPGTNKSFRLNWGVFGGGTKPERGTANREATVSSSAGASSAQTLTKSGPGPEHSIYVGELDPSVTETTLSELFSRRFKSVIGAKVITDPVTKLGKGFGFVKFSNHEESQAAIKEMQGMIFRGRALKTSQAYMKNQSNESNATNLTTNMNPFAAIAGNPFLLNSLSTLAGMGAGGMAGIGGGLSGYSGTQTLQPAYQAGVQMNGMVQGYGGFQQGQTMQTAGYGYGYGAMDPNAYQGFSQGYGAGYGQTAYMGGYFDPMSGQMMGATQQPNYGVGYQQGYQQYDQYGQMQGYNPYFQQQQQQQQQQHQQQVNQYVSSNTSVQQVTPVQTITQANNNLLAETTKLQKSDKIIEESTTSGENMEIKEEINSEPVIVFNAGYISNNFKYDFINGDKMKMIL